MHLNGQTKSVVTFEKLFFLSMFQIIFSTREFKLELVTLNSMQNIRKENTEFLLATLLCFGEGGGGDWWLFLAVFISMCTFLI